MVSRPISSLRITSPRTYSRILMRYWFAAARPYRPRGVVQGDCLSAYTHGVSTACRQISYMRAKAKSHWSPWHVKN